MPGIVPLTGGSGPAGSTAPALAAGAAATASPGGLTSLIQGIQLPRRPDNFNALPDPQKKWIVDVEEYLRRLMAKLGQVTSTIDQIVAAGVKDNRYNAQTHTFQSMYFKQDGTAGPWTDWGGNQPVLIPEVVEEVGAPGGMISDLRVSNVYVLEKGTETSGEICVCGGGGGIDNTCWAQWTSVYDGSNWSTPMLAHYYCGTAPAGVLVGSWVLSDSNATLWQKGPECSSDGDCTTPQTPPAPPFAPACDVAGIRARNGDTINVLLNWPDGGWSNVPAACVWDDGQGGWYATNLNGSGNNLLITCAGVVNDMTQFHYRIWFPSVTDYFVYLDPSDSWNHVNRHTFSGSQVGIDGSIFPGSIFTLTVV